MPDVALSVTSSPLAALLPGGNANSANSTSPRGRDPFAALLDRATGATAPAPSKADPIVPALDAPASKLTDIKAGIATVPATPRAAAAALSALPAPATAEGSSPVEAQVAEAEVPIKAPEGKSEKSDEDDGETTGEDGTDKLAEAIASGPTAVLALAPALVAPTPPHDAASTQAPVKIDAPIAPKPLKPGGAVAAPGVLRSGSADKRTPALASQPSTGRPFSADADSGTRQQSRQGPIADSDPASTTLPTEVPQAVTEAWRMRDGAPAQPAPLARAVSAQLSAIGPAPTASQAPAASQVASAISEARLTVSQPLAAATPSIAASSAAPEAAPHAERPASAAPQGAPEAAAAPAPALAQPTAAAPTSAAPSDTAAPSIEAPIVAPQPQTPQGADARQSAAQHVQPQPETTPTQPRRRSEEATAPRRSGDARRRAHTMPIDAGATGLDQRAAGTAPTPATRPIAGAQNKGDAIIEQTLTIAKDGAWLDTLAKDIAAAGSGNDLHFKLNPENLGALSVAISRKDDGASIRLTADNQQTRDILVDAQPKLIAEARAQGLKVSDTQVDVRQDQNHSQNQSPNQDAQRWSQQQSGQNAMSQNGQNRQSSPGHQPFVSNLRRKPEADSESPDGDSDALYA